ncbi:hypothetical protein K435DRAFT_813332, partial [Dendrothele bispora CBS 962.96]
MSDIPEITTTLANGDAHPLAEADEANEVPDAPLKLEARRVQVRWDDKKGEYVVRDDEPKETKPRKSQVPYAISVARRFVASSRSNKHDVVEELHIHSPHIIEALKVVLKKDTSVNWNAEPLAFQPNTLLPYVPSL